MTAPKKLLETAGARAAPSTFSVPAWFTESGAGQPGDAERVSGTRPTLVFYRPGWEATGPSPLICTFKELSGSCQTNPQTRESPLPSSCGTSPHTHPRPRPASLGSRPACPLEALRSSLFPRGPRTKERASFSSSHNYRGGPPGSCLPLRAACVAGEESASGCALRGGTARWGPGGGAAPQVSGTWWTWKSFEDFKYPFNPKHCRNYLS